MPTNDEIRPILEQAASAVEEAELPQEFRVAAFRKAVDIIVGAHASQSTVRASPDGFLGDSPSPDDPLAQLASKLQIDPELVGETFYVGNEGLPQLGITPGRLASGKAGATKQIALLLAAARQGGGIEDTTASIAIRAAVRGFNRLDGNNFASTLREMSDEFVFEGTGRDLKVRVSRAGYIRAASLVTELSSSSDESP